MFRVLVRAQPVQKAFTSTLRPTIRQFNVGHNAQRGLKFESRTIKSAPKPQVLPRPATRTFNTRPAIPSSTYSNTANYIAAGAAGLGLASVATYALSQSDSNPATEYVRTRVRYTYLYLAGSLGVTAVVARSLFHSGFALRMMSANPWLVFGATFVGLMGAQVAVRSIPYENTIPKHLALGVFASIMGASVCPLVAVGGPLLMQAAAATGAIVGSLAMVGAAAPEGSFQGLTGPLTIGLGCLLAASVGTMIFPGVGLLQNIVVYGGTGLFGLFVMADSRRIMENARYAPTYDPINNCVGIYVSTMNIFINMVTILSGNRRK